MKIEKAVILAAGRGTRMGEITKELPKPMVEVHGKPILEQILVGLRDVAMIRQFYIVTGYQAEVIEGYFGDGSGWGVSIRYGRQEVVDGTGRAPLLAKEWVGGDAFLLSYGDILMDAGEYASFAEMGRGDGMIAVRRGENTAKGGAVVLDGEFRLIDLIEKAEPGTVDTPWYNAGIYVFPSAVFGYAERLEKSPRGEYELTDAVRAMARDGLAFYGCEIRRRWADVRDPQVLSDLRNSDRGES